MSVKHDGTDGTAYPLTQRHDHASTGHADGTDGMLFRCDNTALVLLALCEMQVDK